MNTADFVALVERNAARVTVYKNGGDGSGGKCDCIGLIIGAVRLGGLKWPGTHGSNYAARYQTTGLAADQPLRLGDLVYKAREPGASGYKLPDAYKNHADRRDYYHVGVVLQADPVRIVHCTAGGVRLDEKRGDWQYSAWLRLIKNQQTYAATVTAESGSTVNLRRGPGLQYEILRQVPIGSAVEVLGETDTDWACVAYQGMEGYMMRRFLAPRLSQEDERYEQIILLRQQLDAIQQAVQAAQKALEALVKAE